MAEVLQSMTAEAGFDLKVRVTEFATSLNEAEAGRYQAYALNWSGRPDPDGNLYKKVAGTLLSEGSIVYLYHRLWIVAHTSKLDGFKLLPDGLVRVMGLRMK